MRHATFHAMTPAGLVVDAVTTEADRMLIFAKRGARKRGPKL